jgi:hypothetical protein
MIAPVFMFGMSLNQPGTTAPGHQVSKHIRRASVGRLAKMAKQYYAGFIVQILSNNHATVIRFGSIGSFEG